MNPDARLRRALGPVDPPDGFAARVRARVEQDARPARTRGGRVARWVTIAASVAALLGGPLAWREYEMRRDALAARAQVLLALQIASRELNTVHRKVVRPVGAMEPADSRDAPKEGRQ